MHMAILIILTTSQTALYNRERTNLVITRTIGVVKTQARASHHNCITEDIHAHVCGPAMGQHTTARSYHRHLKPVLAQRPKTGYAAQYLGFK